MSPKAFYSIEVNGVTKRYRRQQRLRPNQTLKGFIVHNILQRHARNKGGFTTALSDITLKVKVGQMVGIIGSNGSGKSTLLKLLAGIGKPTQGSIDVKGRVSALIELGAGFHQEISGRENVFINGKIGRASCRERV